MKSQHTLAFLSCLLCGAVGAVAEEPLNEAERAFAEQMTNATLVGRFTASEKHSPQPERYELGEVRKLDNKNWLIQARIRYGDHDVRLPITLPVEWANDVAVIVVDKVGFPGLGVYSARVMIHEGRYAGYWHGGGHGGHLFGSIEKPKPQPGASDAPAGE